MTISTGRSSGTGSCCTRRDIDILRDIVGYCDIVYEAVEMFGSDEEDFLDNKVYQSSTVFSILQIGELVKRLSLELRDEFGEVTWSKIAGMRDMMAHQYHNVIPEKQWKTITQKIPELKTACLEIIEVLESRKEDD